MPSGGHSEDPLAIARRNISIVSRFVHTTGAGSHSMNSAWRAEALAVRQDPDPAPRPAQGPGSPMHDFERSTVRYSRKRTGFVFVAWATIILVGIAFFSLRGGRCRKLNLRFLASNPKSAPFSRPPSPSCRRQDWRRRRPGTQACQRRSTRLYPPISVRRPWRARDRACRDP
jgi:hypothetical protein